MKRISILLLAIIVCTAFMPLHQKEITVFLIGDSTCADKEADAFPETGWGTPFKTFFDKNLTVENHAKNGRSTKSFIEEGRWNIVLESLNPGDYVFIQFGHNDEVPSKVGRYTTPEEFQSNLREYVTETRSKGANPVLLTPISRRSFDETNKLTDSHEEYAQLVREVASSEKVSLIDMTERSMELISTYGKDKSKLLFHHLTAGEHPNYPNGKKDNTHFNELGARKMAQLVLLGIRELKLDLTDYIVEGER